MKRSSTKRRGQDGKRKHVLDTVDDYEGIFESNFDNVPNRENDVINLQEPITDFDAGSSTSHCRQDDFETATSQNIQTRSVEEQLPTFITSTDDAVCNLAFFEDQDYYKYYASGNMSEGSIDLDNVDINSETEFFEDDIDDVDNMDVNEDLGTSKDDIKDDENQPLFPGATVTLGAFMLLLAMFCTKHMIVGDGIQQLLEIISLILPNDHLLCSNLHSYKLFFKKLTNPLINHYYCRHCLIYIENTNCTMCPNSHCGKPFDVNDKSYFIEIPIVNQLKNLFLQDNFHENLMHRFRRCKQEQSYEDVYDGALYTALSENNGPLSRPENISFTCNTDGAPVFKSSNVSLWPLYLVINELPYKLRMKKENMILAGLWFGSKKPLMSTFLKPFLKTMTDLSEGVEMYASRIGNFVCKGFLLCVTADLPARCLLCNNNQYNGSHSCWKCLQSGKTAKVGKGHTHVYPFHLNDPKGPERTKESAFQDARTAVSQKLAGGKGVVNGIKGPSWLFLYPLFHPIHGVAIDYMHGVLLGVQKLLIRLWFSADFSKEHFSFNKKVAEADRKLLQMCPTLDITRLPRKIDKDLKYWKASEFRSFLLYYGAVVMYEILDDARFAHYLLLVNALHILLKSGSTTIQLESAENMLLEFCRKFAVLYNERFMTLNIHQLVHLADSVRQLGPLFTHSCFSFEDKNAVLLKLIRGTQCIDSQIVTGIAFVQKLPELKQNHIKTGSKEESICLSIDFPYQLKRKMKLGNKMYVLGSMKEKTLTNEEFRAVCLFKGTALLSEKFLTFNRVEINEMLVYSISYKRMCRRDNSAVCFESPVGTLPGFGRVCLFVQLHDHDNVQNIALVEELKCDAYTPNSGILAVKQTKQLVVVPLEKIRDTCIFTSMDANNAYISIFPNKMESD